MTFEALEEQARAACRQGDFERAAAWVIEGYGPELLGFLVAHLHDHALAEDVFSDFCEDFWKGLPKFEWRCSIRTWSYAVLRNCLHRQQRSEHRRRVRQLRLGSDELAAVAEKTRSETLPHLKTEVKSAIRALRERLSDDDRALLILRIDRRMSWNELAHVWLGTDTEPHARQIAAEATKLRKRFERIKGRLRRIAEEEGLLTTPEAPLQPPRAGGGNGEK